MSFTLIRYKIMIIEHLKIHNYFYVYENEIIRNLKCSQQAGLCEKNITKILAWKIYYQTARKIERKKKGQEITQESERLRTQRKKQERRRGGLWPAKRRRGEKKMRKGLFFIEKEKLASARALARHKGASQALARSKGADVYLPNHGRHGPVSSRAWA